MDALMFWFEATDAAAVELASSFGFTPWRAEGPTGGPPELSDARGGLVAIVAEARLLQVVVLVGAETERELAAQMLELPPDELDAAMVSDCLCELANILAGSLKARSDELVGAKLGLPVHVTGEVQPSSGVVHAYLNYRWDERPVAVLLLDRSAV